MAARSKASPMQNVLVAPRVSVVPQLVPVRIPVGAIRWPERVIVGFLIYAALAAVTLPAAPSVRNLVVLLNLAIVLIYGVLIRLDAARRMLVTGVIRDWLPLALVLIAYREMGWLASPHHSHALEAHWVIWDRLALRGGAKALIEAFGSILPSVLEIAYTLVYALAPFSIAVLYLYGRRAQVDTFLFTFSLAVLLCYAQFPFWPSEPPRVVFFGEDLPTYDTVFRHFNLWMLGNYGIHTSVFPSAHVAGAFSVAFGMRLALPERKWVSRFLFVMALLIGVATVYGRYHYLADAAAGFLVAVIVFAVQRRVVSLRAVTRSGAIRSVSVGISAATRPGFLRARTGSPYLPVISPDSAVGAGHALSYSGSKNRSLEAVAFHRNVTTLINQ
jgi:membrane-associated phospholipid phosphatase